jgi:hypothetical protein
MTPAETDFQKLRAHDVAAETRLLWKEIAIAALVAAVVAGYLIWSR